MSEEYSLLCCVVDKDKGSRTLRIAKNHGVMGGTLCLGKGTYKSKLLDMLDLNDVRKEIVFMVASHEIAKKSANAISKEMMFSRPGHGIAFIMPVNNLFGTRDCIEVLPQGELGENMMYNAIFTIVERGSAQEAIDVASSAGAKGGTIINARGSGIHETEMIFAMPIEPEREIAMIIAKDEHTSAITDIIRQKMQIDEPGKGIIFTVPVSDTFGLKE